MRLPQKSVCALLHPVSLCSPEGAAVRGRLAGRGQGLGASRRGVRSEPAELPQEGSAVCYPDVFMCWNLFLCSQVSSVYEARCTADRDPGAPSGGSAGSGGVADAGSDGGWVEPRAQGIFSRTHL